MVAILPIAAAGAILLLSPFLKGCSCILSSEDQKRSDGGPPPSCVPVKMGEDIRITDDPADSIHPWIAANGAGFGISWSDNRDGNYAVYFTRVDSYGQKIGEDKKVSETYHALFPCLAWNGAGHGVAWKNFDGEPPFIGNGDLYFVPLREDGSKIGEDIWIAGNVESGWAPSLIWNGTAFALAWTEIRGIFFTQRERDGRILSESVEINEEVSSPSIPSLAWNGETYGVAWFDLKNALNEIYYKRIGSNGNAIGNDVLIMSAPNGKAFQLSELVWTGVDFAVAWVDWREDPKVYLARFYNNGIKLFDDIEVHSLRYIVAAPSLVWTGSEFGIAWVDAGRSSSLDVFLAIVNPARNVLENYLQVTDVPQHTSAPSLAWDGMQFGVVWVDERNGNEEIYFARIGCQ